MAERTKPEQPQQLTRNGMPLHTRAVSFKSSSWDPEKRTINVCLGTGAEVLRYDWRAGTYYWERLSMDPAHIRQGRMAQGLPFFIDHASWTAQATVGRFIGPETRIENGEIVGPVRLSKAKRHEDTVNDLVDGILTDPSVGYLIYSFDDPSKREKKDGYEVRTAIDWEPTEGSVVGIKADVTAKVRSATTEEDPMDEEQKRAEAEAKAKREAAEAAERKRIADEAAAAERKRSGDIRTLAGRAGMPEKAIAELVDATDAEGRALTVEAASRKILDWKVEQDKRSPTHGTHVGFEADETDKVRSAAAECLAHRSDPRLNPKPTAPGAEDFRGFSLPGMIRFLAERNGVANLRRMTDSELVEHIFSDHADSHRSAVQMTASDFASITAQGMNISFVRLFEAEQPVYGQFCSMRTAPNLEEQIEVDFGTADVMDKIEDDSEIKLGKFKAGALKWRTVGFGKRYPFGRRLILASRIDLLTEVPRQLVQKVMTLRNNLAFLPITRNDMAADGMPLFDARRGNIGTGGPVSVTTLDEMFSKMGLQTDIREQSLNLEPKGLLTPHGKRANASRVVGEVVQANKPENAVPAYMKGLAVIPEGRLDRADADAWYGYADPARFASIIASTLEGQTGPRLSTRLGWEIQGVEIKIEDDFGVTPMSGKGLFKNAGK